MKYCRNYFETYTNSNGGGGGGGSTPIGSANSRNKSNKENRINDSNILLIDDDIQNLKVAYDNGHLVYQVNNNMKLIDFYNFLREKLSILI